MCVPLSLGNDTAKGGINKQHFTNLHREYHPELEQAEKNLIRFAECPLRALDIYDTPQNTGMIPGHTLEVTWIGKPVACPNISRSSAARRCIV